MNHLVVLFFIFYAIFFFVVAALVLYIILWIINKWFLKKKIKLVFWFLVPLGIPLFMIGIAFAYLYFAPYSTSNMDAFLEQNGVGIKFPCYKIIDYESKHIGGGDMKTTYQIEFKHDIDKSFLLSLDSLCLNTSSDSLWFNDSQWEKVGDEYIFSTTYLIDSLIIKPKEKKAIFILYKW